MLRTRRKTLKELTQVAAAEGTSGGAAAGAGAKAGAGADAGAKAGGAGGGEAAAEAEPKAADGEAGDKRAGEEAAATVVVPEIPSALLPACLDDLHKWVVGRGARKGRGGLSWS